MTRDFTPCLAVALFAACDPVVDITGTVTKENGQAAVTAGVRVSCPNGKELPQFGVSSFCKEAKNRGQTAGADR